MKISTRRGILMFAIVLSTTKVLAQVKIITIRVVDNLTKKALNGAVIYVSDSVTSKANYLGYSQIKASSGDTILITCIDYAEKFIVVPTEAKFQVGLEKKEDELDFIGGIRAFYDYWAVNLKYPSKARTQKVQADIYVEFKVDSLGYSRLIKIHGDRDGPFEHEINRVFKNISGNWATEYSNRTFLLPVKFRITSLTPPSGNELGNINVDRKLSEIVVTAYR
jgi:hypothetical protein